MSGEREPKERGRVSFVFLLTVAAVVSSCGSDGPGGGVDRVALDAGALGQNAEVLARGEYLVRSASGCAGCHTPRGATGPDPDRFLAGVECFRDADPDDDTFGCIHSSNLTDHATGLADVSDEELLTMLTKGERPDGTALHPVMPYWVYGNMAVSDAQAIVAYLRTVPGVDHEVPANQAPFTAPDNPTPTVRLDQIPFPDLGYEDVPAALRGRYLAGVVMNCIGCHTVDAPDGSAVALDMSKAFQGGGAFGPTTFATNLTPDPATGLGEWSVDEIVGVLLDGVDRDGQGVCRPMATFDITREDAQDIAHYLRALPPVANAIPMECTAP